MSIWILQGIIVIIGILSIRKNTTSSIDYESQNVLKGLFAIIIVMFHASKSPYDILGIAGAFPIVTFFSMFSGYGVIYSLEKKENYRKRLLEKVFWIVIPYGVVLLLSKMLWNTVFTAGLMWINVILLFYGSVFIASFFSENHRIYFLIVFWIAYIVLFAVFIPNNYLAWTEQSIGFVYGIIWAKYHEKISGIIKKYWGIIALLSMALILLETYLYMGVRSAEYVTSMGFLYRNMLNLGCVIFFIVIATLFSFRSKLLELLGKHSIWIFMFHGVLINALSDSVSEDMLPWVVIIGSVCVAFLYGKAEHYVRNYLNKAVKQKCENSR